MSVCAPELTLHEVHKLYLEVNGFDEENQKKRWVKIQYGPFFFYFPNTNGRVKLLKYENSSDDIVPRSPKLQRYPECE